MKYFILSILILSGIIVRGQINLGLDYNVSTYSTNLGFTFGKQFNSHLFMVGLRINDPKSSSEPLDKINLHPTNFKESLGVKFSYRYFINTSLKINPYIMVTSEYSHCPLRADYLSELSSDSIINPNSYYQYYIGFVHLTGAYHVFDERIGIGFSADISEHFYFTIYGGSGLTWMKYDKGTLIIAMPGPSINNFFGLGLGYSF